jgi:hypothetical protein
MCVDNKLMFLKKSEPVFKIVAKRLAAEAAIEDGK